MRGFRPALLVSLTVCLLSTGCASVPGGRLSPSDQSEGSSGTRGPARITIATFRELSFIPYSAIPGSYELRNAVNPGLAVLDDRGTLRPVLAEAVPSLENGFWKLFPDGRMETTWMIRPGALWHDGVALNADDLLFTLAVGRDRATGAFGQPAYGSIEGVAAPDAQTILLTWREPYIDADQMFTMWLGWPLPKHVLEGPYLNDPASLIQSPFWTQDYVGSGPYQVREYVPGLRIGLEAFDKFLLGRPKIEAIDVVYTPDPSTVLADILAGTVDLTVGLGLPVDSVAEMRERWREGKFSLEFADTRWFTLHPQFIDPAPAVVGDLRFRRALLYAIDRQEMADSLQAGLGPVAQTFMAPDQPDYAGIEARVMKYEFDPRKAIQMIEALGYARGTDGLMHETSGKTLEVEIAGSSDAVTKTMLSVADYWQRVGVASTTFITPPQRATDWEYRATFSSFSLFTGTHDLPALPALLSTQARTAENHYEIGGLPNWSRYRSAELDDLVNRFFRTIPKGERIDLLTRINQHIFENLTTMGLYYFPTPYAVANRVANVPTGRASRASMTWNVHLWDVRG